MGNRFSRQPDTLEAAKKRAAANRHKKLKEKRTSLAHTKEWDPSGCGDQGPTVVEQNHSTGYKEQKVKRASLVATKVWDPSGTDEQGPTIVEQNHSTGYKEQKVKRASLVATKVWDPSGTDEQGPEIIEPNHATGWKAAIEEDIAISEEQKKVRRGSKMRRASHMEKEKVRRASALPTLPTTIEMGALPPGAPKI
jgi:hypothetical protein